jgi:hypothetical protein
MVKRWLAWRPPAFVVEDTSKTGGESKGPTRMNTVGTIPTIRTSFEPNAQPASNPKFLQVVGRRNGTAHLDASNGV